MSIVMQINPFDFFVDTHGDALDSGFIWIGQPNLDPRQYPITAFYDEALTIPAAMPLRTSNGYVVRNGSPTFLFVNGNYSVRVEDSKHRQVYYVPDFLLIGTQQAVTFADLDAAFDELEDATDPAKGSDLIGHYDPYAPTFLKTVSDIINGEDIDVLRGIPKTEWSAIANRTTTLDVTSNVQDIIDEFGNAKRVGGIVFPYGALVMGGLKLNQRGLRVRGSSRIMTHIYPVDGSTLFEVGENSIELSNIWVRPRVYVQGVQSATRCTVVKILSIGGVNSPIDELNLHDVRFEDLIGPALEMISPLRESRIERSRFLGMSDKAGGHGVIKGNMGAGFGDSSNHVHLNDLVIYRFGAPAIQLLGPSVVGKNYYDNWKIGPILIHNQLLDMTLLPVGNPVVAEPTHSVVIQSGTFMYTDEMTITSFHSDWKGLFVVPPPIGAISNGSFTIRSGSITGDDTVTGTNLGNAVHIRDAFSTQIEGLKVRAGFQATDIRVEHTGGFTFTPRVDVSRTMSINQFNPVVDVPTTRIGVNYDAQLVSSDTLTSTNIMKIQRSARTTLTASATSIAVTFASLGMSNMPNGNYDVYPRVVDQNLGVWITATSASGFTINLSANPGTRTVSWFVNDPS